MYTICSPFAICSFWAGRCWAKALELLAPAETETDPELRQGFENLTAAYLRLAEQAERNTKLIIEFEMEPEAKSPDTKPKS